MTLFGSETDCQLEINYLFQKNINPNSYHIKKTHLLTITFILQIILV